MISGLTLEYANARVGARLGQRPDERLWLQLRSARRVPALLEAMRASSAASMVSGVPAGGDADEVELAFRQQLRTRIAEVAAWSPAVWRPAVLYTAHLVDLPALVRLLGDERPPRWIAADPVLAPYALATLAQRRAALSGSPLGALVAAIEREAAVPHAGRRPTPGWPRLRIPTALHPLVLAWHAAWRARWPAMDAEHRTELEQVVKTIRVHLQRFPSITTDAAAAERATLAGRLATAVRRHAARPAALFAYLALLALDLERLRGEFVTRARPVGGPP